MGDTVSNIKCIPERQLNYLKNAWSAHIARPCHLSSGTNRESERPNEDTADVKNGRTEKRTSKSTTPALPLRRKKHSRKRKRPKHAKNEQPC